MPVAYQSGETSAASRRRAAQERKRQREAEARRRREEARRRREEERRRQRESQRQQERNLPVGTTGATRTPRPEVETTTPKTYAARVRAELEADKKRKGGQRWDQRRNARALQGAPTSFGDAMTEAATTKRDQRRARERMNPAVRPAISSFMAGEAAERDREVSRRVQRGELTGRAGFYRWAQEEGRFNPSYDEYLRFVSSRRGITGDAGVELLDTRSRAKRRERRDQARRAREEQAPISGQARVGLSRSLNIGAEDGLSFGSGMFGRSFEPRDTGGPLEFFTETIPGLVAGAFPGAGDVTGQMRLGNNPVSIVPDAGQQGTPAAALASAGAESALRDTVTQAASMAGLPGLAAAQLAEGFLYTPAFFYMMTTDPVGTLKAVYESAKYAVEHPTERPGDLAALAWGVLGGTLGIAGRSGAAGRLGAPGRVAARFTGADLAPGLRTTLTERLPAGQGRHAARERSLEAEIESAPASALASRSRTLRQEIAIDRPRRVTPLERRHLVDTQSEAIRAVEDQTTPRERIAGYQRALPEAKTPGARRRLQRLIRANAEVMKRGLVDDFGWRFAEIARKVDRAEKHGELSPAELDVLHNRSWEEFSKMRGYTDAEIADFRHYLGMVEEGQRLGYTLDDLSATGHFGEPLPIRISPQHPKLVELARQTIASSHRQERTKKTAGVLTEETAQARLAKPGAMFRGDDVVPGENLRMVAPKFPDDEAFRPTVATVESLERDLARARQRLATLEKRKQPRARPQLADLERFDAESVRAIENPRAPIKRATPALDRKIAEERRVISEIEERIAEAERYLPQPEPLTPGIAYGPYKADIEPLRGVVPPAILNKIGRPQSPAMHEFKGGSIASGRVGNVVKLTAQEELKTLRYQERVNAWRQAKKESVAGEEMLRLLDAGEIKLKDIRGVRVRAGTSHIATSQVLSALFRKGDEKASIFDVATREFGSRDELNMLVREADATGQVRFFDNRKVGLQPLRLERGKVVQGALAVVDTVNNLAKFSLLFLGGPAYLTGNLIGQLFMATAHSPLLPAEVAAVFARIHKVKRTLTAEEIAVMRATEGKGISRIIADPRGPIGKLGQLNRTIADAYGKILDDAWRDAAFFLEARKRGYKTPEDVKRLLAGSRSSKERGDLLAIHESVGDAFGAFDKMTRAEREVASRIFFFYPWLRASLEYSAKFPARRPLTTAALVQGGSYAHDKAQTDLIEEFMGQGLGEDEARIAAEFIMREVPGIFLTEGGDAITPVSAAVLSMPGEIVHALPNLFDEPVQSLLQFSSTPFSELAGASLGYDVFRGGGYPDDETFAGRLLDAVSGFSRDVTLARRLTGDQGAMYTYSTGQAIGQRTAGSIGTRGLNAEGISKIVQRELPDDYSATTAPQPTRPRSFAGSLKAAGQRVRNYSEAELERWHEQAAARGLRPEEIEAGESALAAWEDYQRSLLSSRSVPRRFSETVAGEDLTKDSLSWSFRDQTYEHPALATRKWWKQRMPDIADDIDAMYEGYAADRDFQGFYEKARDRLGTLFNWNRVRGLLSDWQEEG